MLSSADLAFGDTPQESATPSNVCQLQDVCTNKNQSFESCVCFALHTAQCVQSTVMPAKFTSVHTAVGQIRHSMTKQCLSVLACAHKVELSVHNCGPSCAQFAQLSTNQTTNVP